MPYLTNHATYEYDAPPGSNDVVLVQAEPAVHPVSPGLQAVEFASNTTDHVSRGIEHTNSPFAARYVIGRFTNRTQTTLIRPIVRVVHVDAATGETLDLESAPLSPQVIEPGDTGFYLVRLPLLSGWTGMTAIVSPNPFTWGWTPDSHRFPVSNQEWHLEARGSQSVLKFSAAVLNDTASTAILQYLVILQDDQGQPFLLDTGYISQLAPSTATKFSGLVFGEVAATRKIEVIVTKVR